MKKSKSKASITDWIDKVSAKQLLETYVKKHLYKKQDISLGSCRFKNGKDNTDGYETRIIVTSGIHPELEKAIIHPRKSRKVASSPIKKETKTKRIKKVTKSKPVTVTRKKRTVESTDKKVTKDITVTDTPVKRRRKKHQLNILDTVKVDDTKYLIEDGMWSPVFKTVYLYLSSSDMRAIGEYDGKNVTIYKYIDKEEEQGFCDWTRFCNYVNHPRELEKN